MNKSTWIWFPGDFEIWLGNKAENQRTERGTFFPPSWKTDSHFVTVEFNTDVDLKKDELITIYAEGRYNVRIDGTFVFGMPSELAIPAGRHEISIKIHNQVSPPALYVSGETVKTGQSWRVTTDGREYSTPGYWNFDSPESKPSQFRLNTKVVTPLECTHADGGDVYDFGREISRYAMLKGVRGTGEIDIFYGESYEEAVDTQGCETLDKLYVENNQVKDLSTGECTPAENGCYTTGSSKAFRYIFIQTTPDASAGRAEALFEFLPVACRGTFRCSDNSVNRIWEVGSYTLHLTTREVFIDGIKRDRWAWSGEAAQSFKMNYYLFYNSDCVKRTLWLLRGKDPVTGHINSDIDNTFFWFISVADYYMYTADIEFVRQIYPRMNSMMQWVIGHTDNDGQTAGLNLFARSLESLAICAKAAGDREGAQKAKDMESEIRGKIESFQDSGSSTGIAASCMRSNELENLCSNGMQEEVLKQIKSYWGGMLDAGATTFWEKYNPSENGKGHFAMYGKPYGKSLCHACGASPVYLIGRYFTGVRPTAPGYSSFEIRPVLGGLEWLEGSVPVPDGEIHVKMDRARIRVTAPSGKGKLIFRSTSAPICSHPAIRLDDMTYCMSFEGGSEEVKVEYTDL